MCVRNSNNQTKTWPQAAEGTEKEIKIKNEHTTSECSENNIRNIK